VKTPAAAEARGRIRPAGERRGRHAHVFAALDLGTNNCRLLIVRPHGQGFRVIDAFSRIVRLGEGLAATGRLSTAAMDRTIDALKVCASKMQRRGVTVVRCVATEACRKATNCAEFLDRVRAETGLELDIISSGEEARMALAGCLPLLDYSHSHALVFDIGGGSTELMWIRLNQGRQPEMLGFISLPCGVVTMAERWAAQRDTEAAWDGMVAEVAGRLRPFETTWNIGEHVQRGGVQMLGTSGTVTTVAGVLLDLPRYERDRVDGSWLSFDDIGRVSRQLMLASLAERAANPCIGYSRADLVVPGCAILEAIRLAWPIGRLRVADRGVREGLLLELMNAADRGER
jgi:exopolyphosphatase/guanosine-5'-triphosphate,3'-diphosphate pyrophosphatase